jgi:hypothetical protein
MRRRTVWLAVTVALAATMSSAQASLGTKPDNTPVTRGVTSIVRASDTIYIGGVFRRIGARTGTGVGIDAVSGQATPGLPQVAGGDVTAVLTDGAGGWYIGGRFKYVGGLPRHGLAHIRADGSVDSFNPSPNGEVDALTTFGTTLYVGGQFTSIAGQTRNNLAALDTSTGAARSWNPNANGGVSAFAVHAGINVADPTVIYVGGFFTSVGGQPRHYVAALDTAGNVTAWNPNANQGVQTLALTGGFGLQPLRIYAGGYFTSIGGQTRNHIAQLDASGNSTSWNPNADGAVYTLAFSAGTLYVGGNFASIGGQPRNYIAALDTTTGNATSWDANASFIILALAVSGNTVYAGGEFGVVGGQTRWNLVALDRGSGAVLDWNPDANSYVLALAVSGTTVYAGGDFTSLGGLTRNGVAALDAATGAPTAWGPTVSGGFVEGLAVSGATVYIGGTFTSVGGQARNHIAAIDRATGAVTAWNPGADGSVEALVVSGGTVYAGGQFTTIGGHSRHYIAAIDASGAVTGWAPNADAAVGKLALSGSTVYAAGNFTSIGGQPRHYLAALGPGGTATGWNPNPNGGIFALAPSGGTVYAGGDFSSIGGQTRHYIAQLDANGNATGWNPNADYSVFALAVRGGTVYAGGAFTTIGGQPRNYLAALDPATGSATGWNPDPDAEVDVIAPSPDGTLYLGGGFRSFGSVVQSGFASFSEPPVNTAPPAIGGTPQPGRTLSCSRGTWSGSTPQSYSYAWLLDGSAIGGATGTSYTVPSTAVGHVVSCRVTATNLGGNASASSAVTISALPPPPKCIVPKVVGKRLTKAKALIRARHCRVGKVKRAYSRKVRKGRVISQKPKPRKVLRNGGKVNLVVSRGRRH